MATNEVRANLQKTMSELRAMGNELRLQMHLATMDAKDLWNNVEPRIETAEHDLAVAADGALGEIAKSLDGLRNSLLELKKRLQKRGN